MQRPMSGGPMNQESEQDMRAEYDIRGGVRGKYFERHRVSAPGLESRYVDFELHTKDSPWVQPPNATASRGRHPSQATVRFGAEPIYALHREVVKPVQQ